jgi:carbamoyltransferase
MYALCEGQNIRIIRRIHLPHSLGFFYTAICQFIGFDRFGEEYKVMGLAAYGKPSYRDMMDELLRFNGKGRYELSLRYFSSIGGSKFQKAFGSAGEIELPLLYSPDLERRLGSPRNRQGEIVAREKDLARSCQDRFEEVVIDCLKWLHGQFPSENLVTAGGCSLNGVCNSRILRDTPFGKAFIHGAASDDGTALGAALYAWNSILRKPRSPVIDHAFWGPEYSEPEVEEALKGRSVPYRRLAPEERLDTVSRLLAEGKVVGWYQGRSEWGPRALGNRSILAHPGYPNMKDMINAKIKRREAFRPFAPSILAEEVDNYFEQSVESPFMMHVVKIRPEKQHQVPAVTHEDGTGRLHTVKRTQNPLYYDLIKAFQARTGIPVLLNTSFNENEPIVDRPEQAVDCYLRTDMDVICAGPFLAEKRTDR